MYSKEVTLMILADWAKGASAEETRSHIQDTLNVKPCLNTIYAHRNGLTAQHLIDELLRQQERAITKSEGDRPALAMKYRNELLKILLPVRIEEYSRKDINIKEIRIVAPWKNKNTESLQPQATTTDPTAVDKPNSIKIPVDSES